MSDVTAESLKEALKALRGELPTWLRSDPELRALLLDVTRAEFSTRLETEDWFSRALTELRRDREEQARKWDEETRKWDEEARRWEAQERKSDEQQRKWEANQAALDRLYEQGNRDREEQARKWDEQQRKWEANQAELLRIHEEIMAQANKFDRSFGALSARWGIRSEKAFRDVLAGILEKSFGAQVLNVTEYDDAGEVFGRPDQIELDIIIRDGLLVICELKSWIDKPGMYSFERKARFYEKRHGRQADRLIVISPMIDARAQKVAERLGIETYGDSTEVESL